jgi:hypothetical protein
MPIGGKCVMLLKEPTLTICDNTFQARMLGDFCAENLVLVCV